MNERGFSPPYITIILAIIGVLVWIFGWKVLIYVAVIFVLVPIITMIYDAVTHEKNCVECIELKEHLSGKFTVPIESIRTKHQEYEDTHIIIMAQIEGIGGVLARVRITGATEDDPIMLLAELEAEMEPVSSVDEAISLIKSFTGRAEDFILPISDGLQDSVGMNMALITDAILAKGWMVDGFEEMDGYRVYLYISDPDSPEPNDN